MRVEIWDGDVTEELVSAFVRLTPFLSSSSPPPDRKILREIITSPTTDQFVARDDDGRIVGVATLAIFQIPTGRRAWIEDVIADPDVSGRGVGAMLTQAMIDRARDVGCRTVELTSRPSREAANHIYRKLGFEPRETNVYRFELDR